MNKIFEVILNYLKQTSTYKGIFAVLGAFGVALKPELTDAIVACALGIIGLIDVLTNENKTEVKE